jgi:hypothetical protein
MAGRSRAETQRWLLEQQTGALVEEELRAVATEVAGLSDAVDDSASLAHDVRNNALRVRQLTYGAPGATVRC